MRLANHADFETESGLYWPPYSDFTLHRSRAEYLAKRWPGGSVLIAGCGWGFTVQHALALGVQAWGVDASPYALRRAREHGHRNVLYGDITTAEWMPDLDVEVVITEDVYPMLTVNEIERAQEVLCGYAPVLHLVSPAPAQVHPSIQTALTLDEWVALLAPDEVLAVTSI